jgi:hypothetical protein
MASDEFGIGRVCPGDYSKFFLTSFFILLHADIVAASDTASGEVPVPVPARLLQAAACARSRASHSRPITCRLYASTPSPT